MLNQYSLCIAGSLLLSSLSVHALGWDKMEGVGKVEQKGVVVAAAEWVKDKDDKFDVSMKITNEFSKTILLFAGDMKCARGTDAAGNIDVHSDRRAVDLRTGESRTVVMTCRGLQKGSKGDFNITMKVFENPTGDSNTPGKVLAEKIIWKQGQKEGKVL